MKQQTGGDAAADVRLTASARRVILLCFFLTGLSGIIYEIVWVRQFTLVFGNTVFAVGAVLAAFMAGLGIGGYVFGVRIEKSGHPILYYGVLELMVGVYALALPFLLKILESSSPGVLAALHDSRSALFLFKFVVSFALLFLPTFFMGASLPLMTHYFVRRRAVFGNVVSFLYGLNTLGAVFGVFLATFAMLPYAGVTRTIQMAFTINAGVGLLAILQYFKLKSVREDSTLDVAETPGEQFRRNHPAVLLVVLLSGFMAMVFEVAWTRTIALLIGSSIYSFSLILLTFLLGIAIGGFICSRFYRGGRRGTFGTLAFCQMAAVVSAAVVLPALPFVTSYMVLVVPKLALQPALMFASNFLVCTFLLLIPTIFLGISFPMAAELYVDRAERSARTVGKVYLFNTFGTIGGSILAGFVLIPVIGVRNTLVLALASGIASGLVAFAFASGVPMLRRALGVVLPIAVAGIVAVSPFWKKEIMTSGSFLYAANLAGMRVPGSLVEKIKMRAGNIVYYHDGAVSTVSVHSTKEHLFLKVNGKTDASTGSDMYTQVLSAYIPMLFRPGASDVLMIGIGSGTTAGMILQFPVEKVKCVEIEKSVARGSRYFKKVNEEYWKDERNEIILEDARNFLLLDGNKYDVIISEPSNPWMAGVASLYTVEAFSSLRDHLKPGGIVCQWFQKYRISEYDLGIALSTFADVFPHVYIFRGAPDDLLLIGSKEQFSLDYRDVQSYLDTLPRVKKGLKEFGIGDALSLLVSSYVADKQYIRKSFKHISLRQTDDTPYLEFFAPLDMFVMPHDFLGKNYWKSLDDIPAVFNAGDEDFTRETYLSLAGQFEKRLMNSKMAEGIYLRLLED
ncbi:MAG: fused MFS/spermidine synthase, partial [bacterium]